LRISRSSNGTSSTRIAATPTAITNPASAKPAHVAIVPASGPLGAGRGWRAAVRLRVFAAAARWRGLLCVDAVAMMISG
jgi:hypothetical protein